MRSVLVCALVLAGCAAGNFNDPPRMSASGPAFITIDMGKDRPMQEATDMAQAYCARDGRNAVPYRTVMLRPGIIRQETFLCSRVRPT